MGRGPRRQHVEEDHHRTGKQRQGDEPQANDCRVDAGVIGKTCSDTHDFAIAAVDEETSVHLNLPRQEQVQAIGSEVAAETSRSAETKAPAKIATVSRTEVKVNISKPLLHYL